MRRARIGYAHWGWREAAAVLAANLGLRSTAPAALVQRLSDMGYGPHLLPVNRARTGLELVLRAMRQHRPDRHQVLVPAYCCPAVPQAVRAAGLEPVAVATGADLNLDPAAVTAQLGPDSLALIAVHMYGAPLGMAALAAACASAGAYLIDDAAHVAGDRLGTLGDAGVLSFNQSKTLTGGTPAGGGVLILNDPALADTTQKLAADLLQPGKTRLRHHLWFAFAYLLDPFAQPLTAHLPRLAQRLGAWCDASDSEKRTMNAAAAAAVMAQMARLPRIRSRRTALIAAYQAACDAHGGLRMVQYRLDTYRTRMILGWDGGPDAERLKADLNSAGIAARRLYPPWSDESALLLPPETARMLELPGNLALSATDVDKIIETAARRVRQAS